MRVISKVSVAAEIRKRVKQIVRKLAGRVACITGGLLPSNGHDAEGDFIFAQVENAFDLVVVERADENGS